MGISIPASSMFAGMRSMPSSCERIPSRGSRMTPSIIASRWLARVVSSASGSCQPSDLVRSPCGSVSTSRTRRPLLASAIPRLRVVAVLPVPPFWLATAMVLHGMVHAPPSAVPRIGRSERLFQKRARVSQTPKRRDGRGMETGKTGVSPPDSGTCPFRSLRQIIRFIWYNYFKQENLFCGRTVEFTFPKPVPRVRVPSPAPAINEGHRRLSVPFDFSLADVQF